MAGCCPFSFSCDQFVNQVSQWLCVKRSYIHNLEEKLAALKATMDDLSARREDLSRKLEREENKGLRRLDQIQVWLTRVETIDSQVKDLLSVENTEIQRLCLCGFCSKSLIKSYCYGKRVFMMLKEVQKEVENHRSNKVFEVVAEQAQASEVVERPIQPSIVGREKMLETTWNRLMENGVGILGMHGMGGVGKTTLLTQINNKFQKDDAFDIVIWVVVSKDLQIQKIQEDIAKKLGLDGDGCNRKDEDQKACDIHNILRRKKFVLLLDDIWAKVNLTKIGVPFPSRENGSKVVFTTRSQKVCGHMGADVEMEVQCLAPNDALDLFRKKVGEITLGSHPNIPELAMVVAKKCHGLPLALNVIGEAMASKRTIQEWHHAIDVLTSNAAEFPEVEDEIFPILKFSYDNLKGEHVKSCLLYCALFPEDERISKRGLIEYWICEGIIEDSGGMERAENKGYEIIGSLVRSSLLMEEDTDKVYMHDVVREMALWIASDQFIVFAGVGLYGIPKFMNWNAVRRMLLMSDMIDLISSSLECPELTTLLLQRNERTLVNISGEFFRSMPRLVVLDLSENRRLSELPDGISQLVSLKYLNLSRTDIRFLPVGLQKLKNLILLDLEGTYKLSSIVGISTLLNLKVLKLQYSGVSKNPKTVEELLVLEHLEILTIGIDCDSGLDQFFSSHKLMCCTQDLWIFDKQLESSDISRLASMEKARDLTLTGCTISETKMDIKSIRSETVSPLQNPTNACFLSLSKIYIWYGNCCKELTWLMFAPNLRVLLIHGADGLEEIINKEKALVDEESGIVPFQKLEFLYLELLPELKNIYWRPLPFLCLRQIKVINCPKLRKLPLNSNGVFEVVAEQAQMSEVVGRHVQPSIGRWETMLETAWNRLMEDGVGILGMYGMGGVGKTTLLTQINNKFLQKDDAFDLVIWVVVSKDLQIQKIQEDIAKKLGMAGDGWNRKDEDQKACDIHNILRRKKFVLLLDDIWAKVNLTDIGVPFPSRENGSKVVFTTRSREVCGRMGANVEMEVQYLAPNDALDLFRNKVGEITLKSHPSIPELAVVLAKECHGLPLALNVIGEAMSYKRTIQEWHHAIDVLTSNAAEFPEVEDEIFRILKFSYDNLKGEHVKSCLLYCALFPEDERISKRGLIEYWICEGIIEDSGGMERAETKGYEIIGSLVRASLLMEEDTDKVYMHDVIREMALWIASDQFIVFAGVGLYGIPKFMNWNAVRRMSLMSDMIDRISSSLECPELTTLLLQRNERTLVNISGEFFWSMPRLVVLDLSSNEILSKLPDGISQLVSLKYLNLSRTDIEFLPVGLQKLKNLIHLDLERTEKLSSIVGISALLNLKVLKLRHSGVSKNPKTVEELLVLENLEILTIGIDCDSGLDQFFNSHKLMCCTQVLEISGKQLESSDIWRLASMEKVRDLTLMECTISETKMDITSIRSETVSPLHNPTNACFLSLSKIFLWSSKSCKELTWLMFAPNLTELSVKVADELEEIINKKKAEEPGIVPFEKLELLRLSNLPKLKNIYWRPLPFPCLKEVEVIHCLKLRKLPLNSESGSSGENGLVITYEERRWLTGVKWEDEATKARFLPSCVKR